MATVIDFASRRVATQGFPVGGMAVTAQPPATPPGDTRHPIFAAMTRVDAVWHLLQAAMAEIELGRTAAGPQQHELELRLAEVGVDRLIGAIDAVMRMSVPTLWLHSRKAKSLKRWLSGIRGRPYWRMEPHIEGWETGLAAEEARLRVTRGPGRTRSADCGGRP